VFFSFPFFLSLPFPGLLDTCENSPQPLRRTCLGQKSQQARGMRWNRLDAIRCNFLLAI
jgi:hypothetical protein